MENQTTQQTDNTQVETAGQENQTQNTEQTTVTTGETSSNETKGKTFSEEEVDQLVKSGQDGLQKDIKALKKQIKDLEQYKPVEKSDAEKALEAKQQELFQKEVSLTLKENNLGEFADIVNVSSSEELKAVIEKLNKIVSNRDIKNSYKPEDRQQQDQYDKAKSKGDVQGMIGQKLSKLFS